MSPVPASDRWPRSEGHGPRGGGREPGDAPGSPTDGGSPAGEPRSYHGQPVLKAPVWSWEIPCYFFAGGLAGASAGLAYLCELRGDEVLARRAWAIALLGVAVSPPLLISDLGRPQRFLNMLRMFKVTSPMSVGSWILVGAGTSTSIAAVSAWTGRLPRAGGLARPAAALLGLPLCTYTGALVANTAVPVWHEARWLLPFVFGAGAALSAGAAAAAATPPAHAGSARRLTLAGAALEVGLKELMERRLGEHAEPYAQGAASRFGLLSRAGVLAGASLLYLRGEKSRPAAVIAGALLCAGAMSARWSVFKAGVQSASDPQYVVGPQRALIERGERRGGSRRLAKVAGVEPRVAGVEPRVAGVEPRVAGVPPTA